MRLLLIGCELLTRELCDAVARSPHLVCAHFLPAGLHEQGAKEMRQWLQQEIDRADATSYDAIVLGYALCGNGLAGLRASAIPLVMPRAHDCIALLMGSRAKFMQYFQTNSNVYFRSAGWVERGAQVQRQVSGMGVNCTFEQLVERYGEENAQYLYEEAMRYERSYNKLAYIETGLEADIRFVKRARAEAERKHWEFETLEGSLTLFRQMLSGEWQEDFLVVPPGYRVAATYGADVVKAVPVDES